MTRKHLAWLFLMALSISFILGTLYGCQTGEASLRAIDGPCPFTEGDDFNACGGYVPACGNLPPLVGDDC